MLIPQRLEKVMHLGKSNPDHDPVKQPKPCQVNPVRHAKEPCQSKIIKSEQLDYKYSGCIEFVGPRITIATGGHNPQAHSSPSHSYHKQ